jgi:hypothetical protein
MPIKKTGQSSAPKKPAAGVKPKKILTSKPLTELLSKLPPKSKYNENEVENLLSSSSSIEEQVDVLPSHSDVKTKEICVSDSELRDTYTETETATATVPEIESNGYKIFGAAVNNMDSDYDSLSETESDNDNDGHSDSDDNDESDTNNPITETILDTNLNINLDADDDVDNETRKKRGRPKKNPHDEQDNSKKKRGRKPKVTKMPTTFNTDAVSDDEPMILRLAVPFEYIEKVKNSKSQDLESSEYESITMSAKDQKQITSSPTLAATAQNNSITNSVKAGVAKQLKLNDYESDEEDKKTCSNCNNSQKTIDLLRKKVISLETKIKNLEKDLHMTANIDYMGSKAIRTRLNFISIENGEQIVAEKTNIACFHDTCKFDGAPRFLPEKFSDGKYYVSKCFCSWNCAMRYNLDLNDHKTWARHRMILEICKEMYNVDNVEPAPHKGTLIKYGGHLSITEFRNSSLMNLKGFRYIEPPMTTLLPIIEENYKKNNGAIPNLTEDMLLRKRSKPLPKSRNNIGEKFCLRAE